MTDSVRGVIFDLDGTLAETHPMAIELIGESIARFGGPELTPQQVMAFFGRNEQGVFRKAIGPGWEPAWDFYLTNYVERHQMCPHPFPGIVELLEALQGRGQRAGLITAKTITTGKLSLEVLGIDTYFSEIRGGGMDGVTKRGDIADVIRAWDVGPEVVAYVGDTASDVEEAQAAGVTSIAAAWSYFADPEALAAASPGHLFTTVAELAAWLHDGVDPPGKPQLR